MAHLRAVGSWLGLAVLVVSAVMATDALGLRERVVGSVGGNARPAAVSRDRAAQAKAAPASVLRSQPWWQRVQDLQGGAGTRSVPLSIGSDAIQWRVTTSCRTGRLRLRQQGRPLSDLSCPVTGGKAYESHGGAVALEVTADGPWQVVVDQQVDVPLVEPPLSEIAAGAATRVAAGRFYRVDQVGRGGLSLYRLPNRRYALRLEDFYVTPNSDLLVQLSPAASPRTTASYDVTTAVTIASLDVTAGSLNFMLPRGVDPAGYRSIGIYCERTHNVYAAAALEPAA